VQTTEERELREDLLKPDVICSRNGYIVLAVVVIFTIVLIVFWGRISNTVSNGLTSLVKSLLKKSPILCYVVLFFILTVWMILPLPGPNIFIMLMALAFKNFIPPFLISYLASHAAGVVIYLLTKYSFRKYLLRKFS
jgi:uncharacterized membrane protein YdjX (TVP38/TMEM64 family)